MSRPALEVADIFRDHGGAWRDANRGHVSLGQLKVMSAIESCRTAALGGHVARCENNACGHTHIAYNSCRNRHCGKCQGSAAREWLEAREAELLPVPYFHVVFSLPAEIGDIAYQNKAVVYDLLMKVSADVMLTIAADPKHLGAKIAITSVLHTWGSALMHHPHVHMIVPGGGLSPDGSKWIRGQREVPAARAACSRRCSAGACWRRLSSRTRPAGCSSSASMRTSPTAPHSPTIWRRSSRQEVARLRQAPVRRAASRARLPRTLHAPCRHLEPAPDPGRRARRHVQVQGLPDRRARPLTTMTVHPHEFIRRFLIHVLPKGLHRIRHYGLLANGQREAESRQGAGPAAREDH